MNRIFTLLCIVFAFYGPPVLSAKHIIGGEITYNCTNFDSANNRVTFRITLKLYRDCASVGGAQYDDPAEIGIYEKFSSTDFRVHAIRNVDIQSIIKIDPNIDNPCVVIPPNVCVQEGIYSFVITLPVSQNTYLISYQRCCRNETISNISQPGDQGAAYTVEITPDAQRVCNNSPTFKKFPPIIICVNTPIDFDHSATDAEGDVVTYEFCTPLIAGGKRGSDLPGSPTSCDGVMPSASNCRPPFRNIIFKTPQYSATNPMGGNPMIRIHPVSGLITGTPTIQGQFVVGVCIKEYRNGILLSEIRRDFQFNVAYCEPTVVAKLQSDSVVNGKQFKINSCGNNTIQFLNQSFNPTYIRDYLWEFDINGKIESITTRDATVTFPGIGSYTGVMMLNRGTACADTAQIHVNVFPSINALFDFTYDTCIAGPIQFMDKSITGSKLITNWSWQFNATQNSTLQNPAFNYSTPGNKSVKLTVTDENLCKDDSVATLSYFPVPPILVVAPSSFVGCAPSEIFFNNLSVPIDSTYDINWDFGDGGTSKKISPTHQYTKPGIYNIKLQVKSPIGCFTEIEFSGWIEMKESPEAIFNYSPKELSSLQREIKLEDLSLRAVARQWIVDNKDNLFGSNPSYFFSDTGLHEITLIAIHQNGCRDTTIQYVDVEPKVTYYMPNAFTPNGDGKNEDFMGTGVYLGLEDFEMSIWDRWGSQVFQTRDPDQGWNGRFQNNGQLLPNGVYVYQVKYLTPRKKKIKLDGFATLIR